MSIDTSNLLRQLGLRGPSGLGARGSAQAPIDQASFAELLDRAKDGSLGSARPVTVESDSGVTLDAGQSLRVSLAADRAEAAGLRQALVLIDGQSLLLDVNQRQITGRAKSANGVVAGVDGVIDLGGAKGGAGASGGIIAGEKTGGPLAGSSAALSSLKSGALGNPSLTRLLESLSQDE